MIRSTVLRSSPFALALLAAPAAAQQAPPGSGQLLRQVQPPPAPPPRREPGLSVQSPAPAVPPDTTPFEVRRIVVDGGSAFPAAALHALVADGEGRTQTLASLQALAQRLTDYYRAHGHPLDRAVIPAQTLREGVVHIRVVEARYGRVRLDNHSRVDATLLQATLAPLRSGEAVTQDRLDRQLLLLNDLPGVQGHSLLRPGSQTGTSDLVVEAQALPAAAGSLTLDDAGDRYTGRMRLGGELAVNNLAGLGDQLSLGLLGADGHMRYGHLGYDFALNGAGTRLGVAYAALGYRLGDGLAELRAHGTATQASVWLSQALLRSPETNLDGRLQLDEHRLRDALGSIGMHDDRHTWDWTASLVLDHRDGWGGGGVTSAQLAVTRGRLGFDDAVAQASDAVAAGTRGRYLHWNGGVSRLQALTGRTRLYLAVDGQVANHNLDSSEQFLLGGPQSVRGYEVSTLAGASGYLATVELRHDLGWGAGRWQGCVFVDQGAAWLQAHRRADASGSNHATLASAGVGLAWAGPRQWVAQLQAARPVGGTPDLAGRRPPTRAWLQLRKAF